MQRHHLGIAIDFTCQIPVPTMTENPDGEWVKWEDYKEIYDTLKELREQLGYTWPENYRAKVNKILHEWEGE